jgi:ribosomal protein S18 acetylase RimI-like enzyme
VETQFRKAKPQAEIRSLLAFDHKVFEKAEWFDREDWRTYESWWLTVNGRKIGCCAFERHVDFQQDIREDGRNSRLRGSLYIASTGILPEFRRHGFGRLMKSWQISYARHHGFTRIVTNTRKSNKSMVDLNKKFGFKKLRTTPGYYDDPPEATVVLELLLRDSI